MKKTVFIILTLCLGIGLAGLAGCDKDKTPSCSAAFGHFYDAQCILVVTDGTNETQLTEAQAVDYCEDGQDDADDCKCKSEYNDVLECFNGIGNQDCSDCDGELTDYYDCVNTSTSC